MRGVPHNGFMADYVAAVRGSIDDFTRHLADGKAKDHEDYRNVVGKIAGLNLALDHFQETVRAYFDIEDGDEIGPGMD